MYEQLHALNMINDMEYYSFWTPKIINMICKTLQTSLPRMENDLHYLVPLDLDFFPILKEIICRMHSSTIRALLSSFK